MQIAIIPATPEIEMTQNLAGKTRGQLISLAEQLTCENWDLYTRYNLNFRISKSYDEEYARQRQVILDQMALVAKAFEPFYLEETGQAAA